ncbi:hypothetical protein EYR38_009791 [Pleurotus pulmonarius]|nr:hypothetical protein EYR38_009791 [Pleurotus pulmonarius]
MADATTPALPPPAYGPAQLGVQHHLPGFFLVDCDEADTAEYDYVTLENGYQHQYQHQYGGEASLEEEEEQQFEGEPQVEYQNANEEELLRNELAEMKMMFMPLRTASLARAVSRRDIFLLAVGAASTYLLSTWLLIPDSITVHTHFTQYPPGRVLDPDHDAASANLPVEVTTTAIASTTVTVLTTRHATKTVRLKQVETATATRTVTETLGFAKSTGVPIDEAADIPETTIVQHAPGWTVFRNLYMAHGTLYVVTSQREAFPSIGRMTSTGIEAKNPNNIEEREATPENMDFLTPEEAKGLWGPDLAIGETFNRIVSIEGNTWLLNDPSQFLRHYYHLVAELLFGAWAMWTGSFTAASQDMAFQYASTSAYPPPPPVNRIIFAHATADGWRDSPGFDAYFVRAALPSTTIEHAEDWLDRIALSTTNTSRDDAYSAGHQRAWHFPVVLLADRTAAFHGEACGSRTQRTAAEAWEAVRARGQLPGLRVGGWWAPVREAALRAGGPAVEEAKVLEGTQLPVPETIVITYISRQRGGRRKLVEENHEGLVDALMELVERKGRGWEFHPLEAEGMTKDQQVRAVSRSTIMLGVHGNGLTHLVLMPPSRLSTVIEIFYPGGFAHDYQWTATALGMAHFSVWNDTYYSAAEKPNVNYPEGFQGNEIPVHGPAIAKLIEDRVEGRI